MTEQPTPSEAREMLIAELEKDDPEWAEHVRNVRPSIAAQDTFAQAAYRALTTALAERDDARAALRDCVSTNTENCRQRDAAEHAVKFQNELVISANLTTLAAEARCEKLEGALRQIDGIVGLNAVPTSALKEIKRIANNILASGKGEG